MAQKPLAVLLRSARQAKGLTQQQLAGRLYVARQTVSGWEKGRTQPDLDMLRKLCGVLELSPEELLLGEDARPDADCALIRMARCCFWLFCGLCAAQGGLMLWLRHGSIGLYAGILFLCEVTVYPLLAYMLKNREYSILAGYDSSVQYMPAGLRRMVAMLQLVLAAQALVFALLGFILAAAPGCFLWLLLAYAASGLAGLLLVQWKYEGGTFAEEKDRRLARLCRKGDLLGIGMLFLGTFWAVALCAVRDLENRDLPIAAMLVSLLGQCVCGGIVLARQRSAAKAALAGGREMCPLARASCAALAAFCLLFAWMTWALVR